jgi:hypothetical protein
MVSTARSRPLRPALRHRRVLDATLIGALIGAVTALTASGGGLALTEVIWLGTAALLRPPLPRAALHLMWWGAIVMSLFALLAMTACGTGLVDVIPAPCRAATTIDLGWIPFVSSFAASWLGATIVWCLNLRSSHDTDDPQVPPARVA